MKNTQEFIEQLVKIEFIEQSDSFGLFPFQLYVEKSDGTFDMNALALGDVKACYKRTAEYIKSGAKKIFLALDFPKGGDITNDFVAIYTIIDNNYEIQALPYNYENGETYEMILSSTQLDKILEDFKFSISHFNK